MIGQIANGLFSNMQQMATILLNDISMSSQRLWEGKLQQPWPQPNPIDPERLAPAVLHVPLEEISEFKLKVLSRYYVQNYTQWPFYLADSIFHRSVEKVSDLDLASLIHDSAFSRFLNPQLDEVDQLFFKDILTETQPSGDVYKVDFSVMGKLEPLPECYLAPTVTLFERVDRYTIRPLACKINELLVTPEDGPAWELTKYYILQGANSQLVLGVHPRLHFPFDCINAISKAVLPPNHLLLELLYPHCYMQLPLNYGVMFISRSITQNNQREFFSTFPYLKRSVFEIVASCYSGIEGNSSYPTFKYPLERPQIYSEYGTFLNSYYDIIEAHVERVLSHCDPENDRHIQRWADSIAAILPGFPDKEAIKESGVLVKAVTTFIGTVALEHSADHYNIAELPTAKIPWRIRIPPPTSINMQPFNLKQVSWLQDIFRHKMATAMYFKTHTLKRLDQVHYPFSNHEYSEYTDRFKQELRQNNRYLQTHKFIPLKDIASSMQY